MNAPHTARHLPGRQRRGIAVRPVPKPLDPDSVGIFNCAILYAMLDILYSFLRTLALEIVGLFGIFFALGFVLSKLQTAVQTNYHRTIGWKGILLTAWIGTPIHEISHIFFAKIFRHRITHVSLFKPNKVTGNLGHVEHSYNSLSLYQPI